MNTDASNGMACLVGFGCFVLPVLFIVGFAVVVFRMRANKQRREQEAWRAYQDSLVRLRENPRSAEHREEALRMGRIYYSVRTGGGVSAAQELGMANDINAACAHAHQTE